MLNIEKSIECMRIDMGTLLFGVPAMKWPDDLTRYSIALDNKQPDLIIQTGTARGGSAMWLAQSCLAYDGPYVITIDIDPNFDKRLIHHDKIYPVVGSSISNAVVLDVAEISRLAQKVMVILDSDHTAEHVQREIELYSNLVTPGQYLVVEDGLYDYVPGHHFNPGPLTAINNTLVDNPDWRKDSEIENMTELSMYPSGWWIKNG